MLGINLGDLYIVDNQETPDLIWENSNPRNLTYEVGPSSPSLLKPMDLKPA